MKLKWFAFAKSGDLDSLKKLYLEIPSIKANVDVTDRDGFTALYYSLINNHVNICDFLYSCGAVWESIPKSTLVILGKEGEKKGGRRKVDINFYYYFHFFGH